MSDVHVKALDSARHAARGDLGAERLDGVPLREVRLVRAQVGSRELGVGLQPPEESWGIMITAHQVYFLEAPWLLIFPMVLLIGTVLSFILMGDALRDALDPKMR